MIKDLESEMEPYRARYLSDFIVAGGQRIVSEWIAKGEQRESPSLMAQMLIDFLDDRPKSTHTA